jgi:hypothetical protein
MIIDLDNPVTFRRILARVFIAGGNFHQVLPMGLGSPCAKTHDLYKFLVVFIIITDEEDTSYSGTML